MLLYEQQSAHNTKVLVSIYKLQALHQGLSAMLLIRTNQKNQYRVARYSFSSDNDAAPIRLSLRIGFLLRHNRSDMIQNDRSHVSGLRCDENKLVAFVGLVIGHDKRKLTGATTPSADIRVREAQ